LSAFVIVSLFVDTLFLYLLLIPNLTQ
jgi:hypothetical protein